MTGICPNCGENFKQLGSHWRMSSECSYPELDDRMVSILRLMAAFGTVDHRDERPGTNSHIQTTSNRKWKLEMLSEELDWMAGSISEIGPDGDRTYLLTTRKHPAINTLSKEQWNTNNAEDNLVRPHESP